MQGGDETTAKSFKIPPPPNHPPHNQPPRFPPPTPTTTNIPHKKEEEERDNLKDWFESKGGWRYIHFRERERERKRGGLNERRYEMDSQT